MGFVLKTGEPILELGKGRELPMFQWRPQGLRVPFPKKFFLTGRELLERRSGISKRPNEGNQQNFLDKLCVRLPITSYELISSPQRRKSGVVVTPGKRDDCISFRTSTSRILVELEWQGKDDLDLTVEEPNGDILSRFQKKTKLGKLLGGDDGSSGGACSARKKTGREVALYLTRAERKGLKVQRGTYTVRVAFRRPCFKISVKWFLRVSIDGALKVNRQSFTRDNFDKKPFQLEEEIVALQFDY